MATPASSTLDEGIERAPARRLGDDPARAGAAAPQGRAHSYLLAALLVWAFALRVWYGSIGLGQLRFWDERFGLANIESFLDTGSLRPVNAFHPTLSYLPQAALLGAVEKVHRWTGDSRFEVLADTGFTPLGYFLCRLTQALLGALSILLLVRLGKRLFDPTVGLVAGLLLAIVPWHIRQSAIYKPDILLVLMELVALGWALSAVAAPSLGRFARAGAGVGLAMASKFNAGPIAFPLAAGALLRRQPSWRRRLLWLTFAGAVAVALFLALNPDLLTQPEMFRRDFLGGTLRDYARKGARTSHLGIVAHAARTLASPDFHGLLIALAALAGTIWIVAGTRHQGERRRAEVATLLAFPPAYVGIYAAITTNPSPHNWLPLIPFSALAAAFALVHAGRWLAARTPVESARRLGGALVVGLVAVAGVRATAWVYRAVVPSTWSVLMPVMRSAAAERQTRYAVVAGDQPFPETAEDGPDWAVVMSSAGDWQAAHLVPVWSDFEVYPQGEEGAPAPPPSEAPGERTTFAPRPFRSQGPTLLLVAHPWRQVMPPRDLVLRDGAFLPPAMPDFRLVSFELQLPRRGRQRVRLFWGDSELPLDFLGKAGNAQYFVSPRLAPPPAIAPPLRVEGIEPERVLRLVAHVWGR